MDRISVDLDSVVELTERQTDLLLDHLHLLLDRHASNAEGAAHVGRSLVLQQLAVDLNDAVGLPGQLSLQRQAQH